MGDAAGIGAEIIVKALTASGLPNDIRYVVVGSRERILDAMRLCGLRGHLVAVNHPREADYAENTVYCHDLKLVPLDLPYGTVSAAAGECAYRAIAIAMDWAMAGDVAALVTAPINKSALHLAGHCYPGHTELLAQLAGVPEVSLLMERPDLRVIHVTMHLGLLDAIAAIEPGLVFRTIARGYQALLACGTAKPRLAVCGINPHAGEGGLFGRGEEAEKIMPAIREAQQRGWDVSGPHPADTLFYRARRGDFDMVVAMYHDQGLAPIKVLGIDEAVNVTVGLPVIRTSVGHGTAFDIAGKGIADAGGMVAAIRHAVRYAQAKQVRA